MASVALYLAAFANLGAQVQDQPVSPSRFHIRGTIVDAGSGSPLPHARVTLALAGENDAFRTGVTGEDGKFDFEDLAGGKYRLTAECQGYLTRSYDQHDQYFSLVALGSELPSQDLILRLPSEGSISGLVRDEQGDGLRYADVMLFQKSAAAGRASTRLNKLAKTDDRGLYSFSHLQPGKYYVAVSAQPWYARHPGFPKWIAGGAKSPGGTSNPEDENINPVLDVAYPVTFYPGVTEPDAAASIQLPQGGNLKADLSLHPVPALHLRVRVQNPEQSDAGGVIVQQSIFDYHMTPPVQSRQIGKGVVAVAGITPGRYVMTVNSLEQQQIASETRDVSLSRSGDLSRLDSQAFGTLTVAFDQTVPQGQGILAFRDKKSGAATEEEVSGRQKFQFRQKLAPGDYDVDLFNSPDFSIRSLSASGARTTGTTLKIEGTEPVSLTISLQRGKGRIEGLALRSNQPASGVMVVLVPEGREISPAFERREQSNTDGSFAFAMVPPGRYVLLAIANAWGLEWANPRWLDPFLGKGQHAQILQSDGNSTVVRVNVNVQ
jgi:carboxypeptidase family protein